MQNSPALLPTLLAPTLLMRGCVGCAQVFGFCSAPVGNHVQRYDLNQLTTMAWVGQQGDAMRLLVSSPA